MQISNSEKLILLMLADIYKHLGIEGEIDAAFVKSVISHDQPWALNWEYPLLFDEEPTPAAVTEVGEILQMWSFIEAAYKKLTPEKKALVEAEANPFGRDVQFRGFDGNNESKHFSIARFLIDDLGRFDEFSGRDLNSHTPLLDAYQRMLTVSNSLNMGSLAAENIIELLNAAKHHSV